MFIFQLDPNLRRIDQHPIVVNLATVLEIVRVIVRATVRAQSLVPVAGREF